MREDIQKAREKYEYSSFLSKTIAALSKSSYEDAES